MDQKPTPPAPEKKVQPPAPTEIGGAKRDTQPTRFGDWEVNGKCVDF